MDENSENNYHKFLNELSEELTQNNEKNYENENIQNEDSKNHNINNNINIPIASNKCNHNSNNIFENNKNNLINNNLKNNNDNNYYNNFNYSNIYYFNNEKQNPYYNLNNNEFASNEIYKYYINKNNPNESNLILGDEFQQNSQALIEQNDNKKTTNTNNITINGKQIYYTNEAVSIAFNDIFNNTEINLNNIKDMQLLKKKRKRRTKEEVQKEKEILKKEEFKKEKKSIGRKKKIRYEEGIKLSEHSKIADDNIMKKINSYFLESIRNWLNKSFIDDFGCFQDLNNLKKLKKPIFLKIDPKLITINLKRKSVINTMNMKFKDIFSNNISKKYKKIDNEENRKLIQDIYQKQNQFFIIFILELKFIEAFNFFNGQNNLEDYKLFFLEKNIKEDIINKFINNFDKIDKFIKNLFAKQDKNKETLEEIQDYLQRVSILCLNYKEWFQNKFNRSENKKKIENQK